MTDKRSPEAVSGEKSPEEIEAQLRNELDEALLALDELSQEEPEEALSMFDSLPEPVQALPDFQLLSARAHQSLGQLTSARDIALAVLRKDETSPEAHHLLGDILEDLGDLEEAEAHFLKTLSLDRAAYLEHADGARPSLIADLTSVIQNALNEVPSERRPHLRVTLFPEVDEVKSGLDPRALTHLRTENGQATLLAFAANLDAEFGDLDEFELFEPHVKVAAYTEIAAHLGLSEEEIESMGWLPDSGEGDEILGS